jgi:hypothetical protein
MRRIALLGVVAALAACGAPAPDATPARAPDDPGPTEAVTPAPNTPLRYGCTDGTRFTLTQDLETGRAELRIDGQDEAFALTHAVVASGFAYVAEGVRFHGQRETALLQLGSDPERSCRQIDPAPQGQTP